MKKRKTAAENEEKKTVLVVDDEAYICLLLEGMLEGKFNVVKAMDGNRALETYKRVKPDFVLVDIYMPGSNGLELLNQIRKGDALTPVIMMSGYGDSQIVNQALSLGASGYLPKPIPSTGELFKILDVADKKRLRH
jgi:CheY-like chemotaxis protein